MDMKIIIRDEMYQKINNSASNFNADILMKVILSTEMKQKDTVKYGMHNETAITFKQIK